MSKNVINTERLTLRPVLTQDTDEIHKYAGDKSIDMMLFLPNDTVEQTAEFVRNAVLRWADEKPSVMEFVMLYDGRIIGGIGLEAVDEVTYEIGWESVRITEIKDLPQRQVKHFWNMRLMFCPPIR